MCGLCGAFGGAEHWTDGAGATGASRRADRQHRTRVANEVLGLFCLERNDWMAVGESGSDSLTDLDVVQVISH
jgi:hypothetical protein